MTKDEVISKLNHGKRMTHTSFTDDEFIIIEDNMVVDEKGYKFEIDDFFFYRQSTAFDTGWSEYKK